MGENISKNLCGKYSQKLFDHAKQSADDEQQYRRPSGLK